ncbi:lysophospholipid acyltransferase family protein [Alkaliflexus imshenetskii]|uniref:lysophospholipid acyltransferase family protein n=1 Tax=Alkaliflexus imshenetskii TaxID=286730 RepID=UPI0004B96F07|nr:lysophospholipid acyltransferase family protein [Alkaliflexus imshenetskii]
MKSEQFIQALGFYTIYPFLRGVALLPMFLLYRIADIFFLLVLVTGYRKRVVTDNLKRAFPSASSVEIRKIRMRFYQHFCDLFVETIALQHNPVKRVQKRVKVINPEVMQKCIEEGKDVVAVLGHYGNWEWVPVASLTFNALGLSVYRPLKNPYFDKFMLGLRSGFGSVNVPLKQTAREIVNLKRSNKRFALGLISDQSPSKYELHYWTTFLNENTSVILGPEKMARLADAQVVYWQMKKLKRGRYEITFIPFPGDVKKSADYEITEWHVRLLERQILDKPEYWLWSHKRWKYQYLYDKNLHASGSAV